MAKLEIKGAENTISGIKILVDGREMNHVTELDLQLEIFQPNTASITFFVDDIDVDVDVMMRLNAIMEKKGKPQPSGCGPSMQDIVNEIRKQTCELCGGRLVEITDFKDLPDRKHECVSCHRVFVSTPEVEELEKTMQKIYDKIRVHMKDSGKGEE